MRRLLTLAAALWALAVPAFAQAPAPEPMTAAEVETWLDGFMPYALASGDIAGAVVVVVEDGQVLAQKGYGYADVAKRTPVDPAATLFRPGSVSKLFTWTAVMQQVEAGKLDLDADVNRYLDFKVPPVTLRQIMTHTGGFEDAMKGLMADDPKGPVLRDAVRNHIPRQIYRPGTTPAYSNWATALAGYIVERVSGERFDDYIERHVLGPLQMTRSTFRQPLPAPLAPLMSKGYRSGSGDPQPFEMVGPAPAGSLSATGADMAKFMIAHLNGGAGLLKPETTRLMHDSATTLVPGVKRMRLGFYETNRNGRQVIAHGGDTQWFHSELELFVDDGVGVFVSVNSAGRPGAAGALRESLMQGFADRWLPRTTPLPRPTVAAATAAAHARAVSGLYDNTRRPDSSFLRLLGLAAPVRIAANRDGTISVSLITGPGGQPRRWREETPWTWRSVDGDDLLVAQVENGAVTRVAAEPFSPIMMFEPVPAWRSPAWMVPALLVALGALAATAIAWPAAALARRRYGQRFALEGGAAVAHRTVRLFAVAAVATFVAWAVGLGWLMSSLANASVRNDGLLWTLHVLALVVFGGGAVVGLWNVAVVWRRPGRSLFARAWSLVLAAAFLVLLYLAVMLRLIGFSVAY